MVANESIKSIQSSSLDDLANALMTNLDRNKIFPPFYNDPEELINPSKIKTTGPPRPPNGFLLCRKNVHKQAKERGICNMRAISKVTGILWRTASTDEKEQYEKLAIEVQNLHSKRYPGYKYKPTARNNNGNNNNNNNNNNSHHHHHHGNHHHHHHHNHKNNNNYNNHNNANITQIPTPITTPISTPATTNAIHHNNIPNNNHINHKNAKKSLNLYHHNHHHHNQPYYIPQPMFVSNPIMPQQPIINGYEIPEFTQEDFQMLSLFL